MFFLPDLVIMSWKGKTKINVIDISSSGTQSAILVQILHLLCFIAVVRTSGKSQGFPIYLAATSISHENSVASVFLRLLFVRWLWWDVLEHRYMLYITNSSVLSLCYNAVVNSCCLLRSHCPDFLLVFALSLLILFSFFLSHFSGWAPSSCGIVSFSAVLSHSISNTFGSTEAGRSFTQYWRRTEQDRCCWLPSLLCKFLWA